MTHAFVGKHVFGEFYGVPLETLSLSNNVSAALQNAVERCGATLCDMLIKDFEPAGFTALALLSESHISIHTYPECGALFIDAFTCGRRCKPELAVRQLRLHFAPTNVRLSIIDRGPGLVGWPVGPSPEVGAGIAIADVRVETRPSGAWVAQQRRGI